MKFTEFLIESLDQKRYGRHAFFGTERESHVVDEIHSVITDRLHDHVETLGLEGNPPFDIQIKQDRFYIEGDYDADDFEDDDDREQYRLNRSMKSVADEHVENRETELLNKLFKQITQHGEHFVLRQYGDTEFHSHGGSGRGEHFLVAYMITISHVPYQEQDPDVALPPQLIKQLTNEVEEELNLLLQDHIKDIRVSVVEGSGQRATHVTMHDKQVHRRPYKYYTMLITYEWYHGAIHAPKKEGEVSLPNENESFRSAVAQLTTMTSQPLEEFLPLVASHIEEQS